MDRLHDALEATFSRENGFEIYPFLVARYNALVSRHFTLPLQQPNQIGYLILSTPSMFEATFLPWLRHRFVHDKLLGNDANLDALDACMTDLALHVKDSLPNDVKNELIIHHDFTMIEPHRRPAVLMPTMGHVAGAATYYQLDDINAVDCVNCHDLIDKLSLLSNQRKVVGVSIHPRYGGWFAYRIVFLHRDLTVSDDAAAILARTTADRYLSTNKQIGQLLFEFNMHWDKVQWRRLGLLTLPQLEYSSLCQDYFALDPSDRSALIKKFIERSQQNG